MVARGVLVTGDREAPHDAAVALSDENRGVRVALERAEVAALVVHAAPTLRGDEPALRLTADRIPERDELRRVARLGAADHEVDSTTTPAPPRRESPAAASEPSSRTSTAAAPPKKRFLRRQRVTS